MVLQVRTKRLGNIARQWLFGFIPILGIASRTFTDGSSLAKSKLFECHAGHFGRTKTMSPWQHVNHGRSCPVSPSKTLTLLLAAPKRRFSSLSSSARR